MTERKAMHPHSSRRRLPATGCVLSVAAALAICASGSSIAAGQSTPHHPAKHHHKRKHKRKSSLSGTWSGSYSGRFTGKFTVKWRQSGSNLRGSIRLSFPKGKYTCTGTVHHGAISFGAVGAGATYTGSVSGRSMSGTYHTAVGNGSWHAHKTH
jgi:hypothetical protein